jgi:hypothetical protein
MNEGRSSAAVPHGTLTHEGLRVCVRTKRKPQISPLRYLGFPVEFGGVCDLHAAFLTKAAHVAVSSAAWQEIRVRSDFVTFLSSGVVCGRKAPKSICQQASPGSFDSAL